MQKMTPLADNTTVGSSNFSNGTAVSYSNGASSNGSAAAIKLSSRGDSNVNSNTHGYGMSPRTTTSSFNCSSTLPPLAQVIAGGGGRSLRDRIVTNKNSSSSSSASGGAGEGGAGRTGGGAGGDSSETSRRNRNRNTRVLVTGASGFIGSHCVKRLLERGYRVRGTVRDISKRAAIEPLYLLSRKRREQLELVEAELLDKHSWQAAVQDCDFVVHVASPVPLEEPNDRFDIIRQAVQGTLNVLEACRDSGCVRHVVMTSSSVTMYDSFNPPPPRRNLLGGGAGGSFSNGPTNVANGGGADEGADTTSGSNKHRHRHEHRKFSDFLPSRNQSSQMAYTSSSSRSKEHPPLQYRYSTKGGGCGGRSVSAPNSGRYRIGLGSCHGSSVKERVEPGDEDEDQEDGFSSTSNSAHTDNGGGVLSNSALKQKVRALAALAQRGKSEEKLHDEKEWTDLEDGRWHMAYTESKVRAEKTAWDFYYSLPSEKRFAFTIIAPTITLGPVLHGRDGSSLIFMLYLLTSGSPFMPHMGIETCDVRDVAEAHARALEMESSHERRIVIYTQTMWYAEIADVIRREFGPLGYSVPTVKAPAWLLRAMARFSPHLRLVVSRLNRFPRWNNASMREDLQLEPRVIDVSIIDMMHSLIQRGDVKMTRRYRDWLERNPHAVFFPRTESNV